MTSRHLIFARGISRHHDAPQPLIDILDAESDLSVAVDKTGRLYRPHFGVTSGFLVHIDCDVRRGLIIVHLVVVDARGDILKNEDTIRLDRDGALAAAVRVAALVPDGDGEVWASDVFVACGGAA